jgi:integrase
MVGLLRENGIAVFKPRTKPGRVVEQREFTDDELTRFFAQPLKEEHRVLFRFLLATGARPAEVIPSIRSTHVALLKSEIFREKNIVLIRNAKVRTGQKIRLRQICIPADLMEDVLKLAAKNPGQHVFHRNSNLHALFDRICRKAGIPKVDELGRKVTAHSFRHTYGTKLSEAVDGNQFVLKQTLGHSRISTTDRYVHALATNLVIDITEQKQMPG